MSERRSPLDRARLVLRCAQLYYGLGPGLPGGLRQGDVARRLGVPRSQVVLWLKEAREELLEVRIRAPRAEGLELPLEARLAPWGVREVRVVADAGISEAASAAAAGEEAARWLAGAVRPGLRVGLAGGRTLLALVRAVLRGPPLPRLSLFPLAAGGSLPVSANALVAMLGGACGDGTEAAGLWVPPLRPGRAEDLRAFERADVRAVLRAAARVDVALLGIGSTVGPEGVRSLREYLGASAAEARRTARDGAAGFVLQQFIDAGGCDCPCPLGARNLAVPLDVVRRMARAHPRRMSVLAAGGARKAAAVAAAVRGRLASVLVVDSSIAGALLEAFPASTAISRHSRNREERP